MINDRMKQVLKQTLRQWALYATCILLHACGSKEADPSNKKALLEQLKKEHADLEIKISKLEAEIAASQPDQKVNTVKMVRVDTIRPTAYNHYIDIQGRVETDNNIQITSETGGIIKKLHVKRGDRVTKGQILAEIDGTLIRKSMEALEVNLELAKTTFEKQEKLWKENVGTELQFLQTKATLDNLNAQKETLNEQLRKTQIRAPFDGYIDAILTKEGEMAVPAMPIIMLVNYKEYKVVAELAESYISKINVGDEVYVKFPDAEVEIKARITAIGSAISPINRTFTIDIKLPEMGNKIKPNMIAYLRVCDFFKNNAVVVPINTIQNARDYQFVYLAASGRVVRRKVSVKDTYASKALISEGLSPGELLITFGYNDLSEGQEIKY